MNQRFSTRISEFQMVQVLTSFLREHGYKVWHEVPNMGQSADLVALKDSTLTFVEAKLADWRRALKQCRAHHQVADFICVAIASKRVPKTLVREAEAHGYGVIYFDQNQWSYRWLRLPDRNTDWWPPQRQRVDESLKQIEYAS